MKKFYLALLAALWMGVATASAQSTGAYDERYDVNRDGKCNSADVAVLVHWLVTNKGAYDATYDVNKDLVCDANDVSDLVTYLLTKDADTHEYVDLGLPSGTMWATCNVGASSPEEYGDYFAWGETTPQSSNTYDWTSYKWMAPGQSDWDYCTKYTRADGQTDASWYSDGIYIGTTVDGITYTNLCILEPEDDAAYANWGDNWVMPTHAQQEELVNSSYTTTEWTTMNDVKGLKITSKTNGNSIFLPNAGYRDETEYDAVQSMGLYWSSEIYPGYSDCACVLSFKENEYVRTDGDYDRGYGLSVRPVRALGDSPVLVTSISLPLKLSVVAGPAHVVTIPVTVSPSNAANQELEWVSSDESVVMVFDGRVMGMQKGQAYVTAKSTDGSDVSASCLVTVRNEDDPDSNGYEYVDLGITDDSGRPIYFAPKNLGANSPEDYGDYIAWGETSGYIPSAGSSDYKTNFSWSTYTLCNGSESTMTKYCTDSKYGTVDGNTTLELSDDAAHAKWGGDWRMPTEEEMTKLRTECTWSWCTQNNVYGFRVTGNGNSIFLPAAGYRSGTGRYNQKQFGCYWTSTLYADENDAAHYLFFYGNNSPAYKSGYSNRCEGLSIRPVLYLPVRVTDISLSAYSLHLKVGDASTLTATVEPSDAANQKVTWTSDNPDVATVAADGTVTAVALGYATITCEAQDGSGVATTCYVRVIRDNLLPGKFSVSASKQVQFTRGNLYWDGSDFKLEEDQTDYPTKWDTEHVGHFLWNNIEDYQSGNAAYKPYASGHSCSHYSEHDKFWCGKDNPLTVDGTDGLYTLTGGEDGGWNYLFNKRTNASNLYKINVTVTDEDESYRYCMVIAPDDYDFTTKPLASSYTLDQLNADGLVCLPPAGQRNATIVNTGGAGIYWSSSPTENEYAAYCLSFQSTDIDAVGYASRPFGFSVRLVRAVE